MGHDLTNISHPTAELLNPLMSLWEEFNHAFFDDRLPHPVITVTGRRQGAFGSFCSKGFAHRHDDHRHADEIRINPAYFASHGDLELIQTFGHEMVHQEQNHFGKPGKFGYHNRAWADRMEEIGLMPSSTGAPGGKRTGRSIADYVIPGGRFHQVAERLLANGWSVPWTRAFPVSQAVAIVGPSIITEPEKLSLSGKRIKYSCRACDANAWAKPALPLVCGRCSVAMMPGAVAGR